MNGHQTVIDVVDTQLVMVSSVTTLLFSFAGEIANVAGTVYDFRSATLLRDKIPEVHGSPGVPGFDLNYCLSPCTGDTAAARLVHRDSGRVLQVFTDQPGLQFYTGNYIDGIPGKLDANYKQHSSLSLETQNYPDAIHHVSCPLVSSVMSRVISLFAWLYCCRMVECIESLLGKRVNFSQCYTVLDVDHKPSLIEEDFAKTAKAHCKGAYPLLATLSRRGLIPVKLAYNLRRPGGRLH